MKKIINIYSIIASVSVIGIVLMSLFVIDIGLNRKYFIRQDFEEAFKNRMTGNCDAFSRYVAEDYRNDWKDRCLNEKNRTEATFIPISSFTITEITVEKNKAFLSVELERQVSLDDDLMYDVTYELLNIDSSLIPRWVINQELH